MSDMYKKESNTKKYTADRKIRDVKSLPTQKKTHRASRRLIALPDKNISEKETQKMNIYKNSLVIAASLSIVLALASCSPVKTSYENKDTEIEQSGDQGSEKPDDKSSDGKSGKEVPSYTGTEIETVEVQPGAPEYPASYPTEADIIDMYKKAAAAVEWFNNISVPPLDRDITAEIDGLMYAKVKSQTVVDLDSLRAYLETLLDKDMADLLIDYNTEINRFVEKDGALYCTTFAFAVQGYSGEETYSVTKKSDDEYTLEVSYQKFDEEGNVKADRVQKCNFKKLDGRWVFEDFLLYCI